MVLAVAFAAYTYKCFDCFLTIGVQNALALKADQTSATFAHTGQILAPKVIKTPELGDILVTVHPTGDGPIDFEKPTTPSLTTIKTHRDSEAPDVAATSQRNEASDSQYLIATAPFRVGSQKYIVDVRTPRRPSRTVLHSALPLLPVGLSVAFLVASVGSWLLIRRALAPVQRLHMAAKSLPVADSDRPFEPADARTQIEKLCVVADEMIGRVEKTFEIGTSFPWEAIHKSSNRVANARGELESVVGQTRLTAENGRRLSRLLVETERLCEIAGNLSTTANQESVQLRTARLRHYLGGFAGVAGERVCKLTKKLATELVVEARTLSGKGRRVQW